MTSVSDIISTVTQSDPDDWERWETDWSQCDPDGSEGLMAVYQPDVQLRIERGPKQHDFTEEWSEQYADTENNELYNFWVMYGQSPIDHTPLVAVDGYRAYISPPDRPDSGDSPRTLSQYEYMIGAALSFNLKEYERHLQTANIEVR